MRYAREHREVPMRSRLLFILSSLAGILACGSSSSSEASAAASSGTGGCVGAGCRPAPRGAWTVGFVSGGGQCQIAGHSTKVGDVTDHTFDSVLVDGGPEGAMVQCSVAGTSTFVVDAQESAQAS